MKPCDRNNLFISFPRYCVTPQQTLSVARHNGLDGNQLSLGGIAVFTFNQAIVERLEELCKLQDTPWISPRHHPYSAVQVVKIGQFEDLSIAVLVPPMGASPLACIVEDLIACGIRAVFLVCAAWSLGPPVESGDLIVPEFSIGPDGTSIHYGNTTGHIVAGPAVVEALTAACRDRKAKVHTGGNATCEALYRITPQMVADFRQRGCLCMENGEANTLFAMSQALGFLGGVLFQPYIDLQQGWNPACLDDRYRATCIVQAEAVLDTSIRLRKQGLL
jgi:uridine phosphorylase